MVTAFQEGLTSGVAHAHLIVFFVDVFEGKMYWTANGVEQNQDLPLFSSDVLSLVHFYQQVLLFYLL